MFGNRESNGIRHGHASVDYATRHWNYLPFVVGLRCHVCGNDDLRFVDHRLGIAALIEPHVMRVKWYYSDKLLVKRHAGHTKNKEGPVGWTGP